ncbi:flagellar hook protein FlgE [Roseobacteraceae bacterium S113]
MTISSSLNAGVSGLSANASRLATISDNIANASTMGYKRVQTDFQSLVNAAGGSAGAYSAGGVSASNSRMIDQKGSLVSTANSTDLAIRGRGFLPVAQASDVDVANGASQMFLTSTGSFRTDDQGYLRTQSGLVLLGWPAGPDGTIPNYPRDTSDGLEPVQINVNQFSGEPTTRISLGVNLPATSTLGGAASVAGGALDEFATVEYYDNLGTSQSIGIQFAPTGTANEWTMLLTDSAQPGVTIGEYTLTFNDSRSDGGTLSSVVTTTGGTYASATGEVIINVSGGPMTIDIGRLGTSDGLTQLSDSYAPLSINKDGSPVGNMTAVEVDDNGFVFAFFDTGITRRIFQVPLVDIPNPNGLVAVDQQSYMPSPESGTFYLWDASDGPTGNVVGYALEESTTDVAGELTNLIQTQRAYTSNAKVIQTVDEMLQETTNIKR